MGASMGGGMPRAKSKLEQFTDKLKLNKEQQEQAQPHATSVLKGWRGDHRGGSPRAALPRRARRRAP